jgi:hypothetical protein
MTANSSKWEVKKATAKAKTARLFFLSASSGEVFSANPDGSDLKVIVSEGRRLPDGIVVDAASLPALRVRSMVRILPHIPPTASAWGLAFSL